MLKELTSVVMHTCRQYAQVQGAAPAGQAQALVEDEDLSDEAL